MRSEDRNDLWLGRVSIKKLIVELVRARSQGAQTPIRTGPDTLELRIGIPVDGNSRLLRLLPAWLREHGAAVRRGDEKAMSADQNLIEEAFEAFAAGAKAVTVSDDGLLLMEANPAGAPPNTHEK